ncbi:Cyclin-dependent kinase C-1 [Lathyrus oleraceus]|uniref:Cyclin-dependent kinase C-1 n=1 Tax=Pisum sativum TaxID=3888 RepID=A0A9D4WVR7_PEA|nr:Cyclin-dependent kinase C-1 [Pisum sativum]
MGREGSYVEEVWKLLVMQEVYMAREIKTCEIVALKKIRMDNEREGFPITAIREIKILKKLDHENVIKLKEIVTSPGLADRSGMRFTVPQIKCYMRQLLTGLHYCHVNQVLHRDIKGSNLLIDNEVNLGGWCYEMAKACTDLFYHIFRPPELLLGITRYGQDVDMWPVGCIFTELLHGKPIFLGKDKPEQINKIFELCGAPDEVNWPGVQKTPWYNQFKPTKPMKRRLREVFRHFDRPALELLEKMLTLDPARGGQQHAQMRQGPTHSIHGSQPTVTAGPSHHYGPPNYPQGGPPPSGGLALGRGSNTMGGNRNQQYGWQ